MDALTTIVAGVVVAVVGAIVAFYFGGVREKQKREYQRQQEEQRRQDEQNKGRAEALTEIRSRAANVVADVRNWAAKAAGLPNKLPTILNEERAKRFMTEHYNEVAHQADNISSEMLSLRLYYQSHASQLTGTTHRAFESFDKEFDSRYTPLAQYFENSGEVEQALNLTGGGRSLILQGSLLAFKAMTLGYSDRWEDDEIRDLKKAWKPMVEAAEYAQDWDFSPHQAALGGEVED